MRLHLRRNVLLAMVLAVSVAPSSAQAQTPAETPYHAKRQKAIELFRQGQRLQALPLLEELAKSDPKDDEVLVALAASLVDHAATLTDQDAAAKERFRARDLLDQAWNLGNHSPLAENLGHLLKELPASGAIKFSDNPEVQQDVSAGEAAFARRNFDEALKDYGKALKIEPANYSAALFTGNTYDRMNSFAKAGEWYEHAIRLDPNIETAYRYYADMLAKNGDMAKARSLLIGAAVAEPYNRMVWRELRAWATINHTEINLVYVGVPAPPKDGQPALAKSASAQLADVSSAWQAYRTVKASWQAEEFKKRFPQEAEYRHSLAEEFEALTAAAIILEKLTDDKMTAESVSNDPASALLLRLHQAGAIEAYVLFSLGDSGIARNYAPYRAKKRAKLEEYMDKFVVPPAPAGKQ
jgi:Flp pilus assembly protein TadD